MPCKSRNTIQITTQHFNAMRVRDDSYTGKRTLSPAALVGLDGRSCGAITVAGVAGAECRDLGVSTEEHHANARHGGYPLFFLPPRAEAVNALPVPYAARAAAALRVALEAQQIHVRSFPCQQWQSIYYIHTAATIGFGSLIEYHLQCAC